MAGINATEEALPKAVPEGSGSVPTTRGTWNAERGTFHQVFPFISNASISPGFACRPRLRFEKTSAPSAVTSKAPPEDFLSSNCASGNACLSSATRPVARGS